MAFATTIGERWERMAPRERRLVAFLGATFAVCVGAFGALRVGDALGELEDGNAAMREAIAGVTRHQAELASGKAKPAPAAAIGDEAVALASYVDAIADELGVALPETSPRTGPAKGKFQEKTIDVTMRNVTLDQLASLLERVETRETGVVTQRLSVKPYRNQPERMDVELTIATWERVKAGKNAGKEKEKEKDEKGGKTDAKAAKEGTIDDEKPAASGAKPPSPPDEAGKVAP